MTRRNSDSAPRIAIVTAIDYLPVSATLMNTIRLLGKVGYKIDFICQSTAKAWDLPEFSDIDFTYHFAPRLNELRIPGLGLFIQTILTFWICLTRRPLAILAIDQEGLMAAGPSAILAQIPMIYLSLELRFKSTLKSRFFKFWEKFYFNIVKFTIIQDKHRGEVLLQTLDVEKSDMEKHDLIFIPHTNGITPPPTKRGNYIRKRWNIPDSNKVILYCGGFTDVNMVNELALSAKTWDPKWTLIIHGWKGYQDYFDELKEICDGKHIILSEEVLKVEELDEFVSSADIGVALYKPIDENFYVMGLSSGKIWLYLRGGLPVITVDFPNLVEMVDHGRFGLYIHQPEEMSDAIQKILDDYSRFEKNSRVYFKKYGDFSTAFKPVLERLTALNNE